MHFLRPITLLLTLVAFSAAANAFDILYVVDGDSLRGKNDERARLLCIDTPESKQRGGKAAKKALEHLLNSGDIHIKKRGTDRYNRHLVLLVRTDGTSINLEMIRQGHAWIYRRYMNNCGVPAEKLLAAEDEARREKRGLWALPNPQPPWEWRKENRR